MTPREANQNSHSQPLLPKGQPCTVRLTTQEENCEQRNRESTTYQLIAAVSRVLICSVQDCNRVGAH